MKGRYNKRFVASVLKELRIRDERIVLVDLGGKLDGLEEGKPQLTKENLAMLKECDAYIVLSRDKNLLHIWDILVGSVENKKGKQLRCVAQLDSTMESRLGNAIYSETGGTFRGRLYKLSRGNSPKDSKIILSRLARYLLSMTKNEAKPMQRFDVDGIEITQCLFNMGFIDKSKMVVEEDCTEFNKRAYIPKRFFPRLEEFLKRYLPKVLETMEVPEEVTLGHMPNNHSTVAICDALYKIGVKRILIYDVALKKCMPIPEVEEVPTSIVTGGYDEIFTNSYLIESTKSIFLNIDRFGRTFTEKDLSNKFPIPKINDDKTLYVSGRIPSHLLVGICRASGAKKIYTFTPGVGFVCVKSDDQRELGTRVKKIPEIDTDAFFEDRKGERLNKEPRELREFPYLYVDERFRTPEDLKRAELLLWKAELDKQPENEHDSVVHPVVKKSGKGGKKGNSAPGKKRNLVPGKKGEVTPPNLTKSQKAELLEMIRRAAEKREEEQRKKEEASKLSEISTATKRRKRKDRRGN